MERSSRRSQKPWVGGAGQLPRLVRLPGNDGQDRLQKTLVGLRDFDFGSVADDLAPDQLLAGLVLTIRFTEDFPQQLFFP